MFNRKKDRPTISDEIDYCLLKMRDFDVGSAEYYTAAQTVKILKEAESKRPIDYNVLVAGGIAILQMIGILSFERFNVLTSRAVGFVWKGRK